MDDFKVELQYTCFISTLFQETMIFTIREAVNILTNNLDLNKTEI